eukprot:681426-Prorocentrum_minimum.AAC.1
MAGLRAGDEPGLFGGKPVPAGAGGVRGGGGGGAAGGGEAGGWVRTFRGCAGLGRLRPPQLGGGGCQEPGACRPRWWGGGRARGAHQQPE